jgi:hypothetical protein
VKPKKIENTLSALQDYEFYWQRQVSHITVFTKSKCDYDLGPTWLWDKPCHFLLKIDVDVKEISCTKLMDVLMLEIQVSNSDFLPIKMFK